MPVGAPDMAFTPSDPKPLTPPINSLMDLLTFNQYAFSLLFGPSLGNILWMLIVILLSYGIVSFIRMILRWQFYDLVYPKPKKHHPK
jgi:hypothetical protein